MMEKTESKVAFEGVARGCYLCWAFERAVYFFRAFISPELVTDCFIVDRTLRECPDQPSTPDSARPSLNQILPFPLDEYSLTGGDPPPIQAKTAASQGNKRCRSEDRFIGVSNNEVQKAESAQQPRAPPTQNDCRLHAKIRRSHSTPGLTCRVSEKLSITFGHPTVIRRTGRSRPSVRALEGPTSFPSLSKQGDNAQDSSDPSSTGPSDSSSPPFSQSTNPTSEGLSRSPKRVGQAGSVLDTTNKIVSLWTREADKKLTPVGEFPIIPPPSIITVEAAATAKIFFETYFNSIFSGTDPRSQRLQELEEQLYSLPATSEERLRARNSWISQESEYLRQSRVLKTRSNSARPRETVSIAGYEIIRILGKGSFGVVRLVKEKKESEEASPVALGEGLSLLGTDLSRLKVGSVAGILRPTVNGFRPNRRADLSKMKKEVFAMKVIRKSDMLRSSQEGHLRAERDFLVASEKSRWIVPLIASFQDTNNLYLVMDYMVGGDFLGLLIRKNILSEDVTRWYIAEMILCVEETHRLRWIHRDVKPDNFLISASGHLKISDFGLAFDGHWTHDQSYFNNHRYSLVEKLGIKIEGDALDQEEAKSANAAISGPVGAHDTPNSPEPYKCVLRWRNRNERRKLAKSVVGTSQYMAPEVIRGELYDGRCDWWSIGIILYEVWMISILSL